MAFFKRLVYKELVSAYEGPGIDLGTLKLFAFDGTNRNVVNFAAGSAAWTAASCASYSPVGTRAIYAGAFIQTGAVAAGQVELGYAFDSVNTHGAPTINTHPQIRQNWDARAALGASQIGFYVLLIIPVVSQQFYYYRYANTNTVTPQLAVWVHGYVL